MSITAWELLFERLGFSTESADRVLVLGAGGGVGSSVIQIARAFTQLHVSATASRPETREWMRARGAHTALNHANSLTHEARQHDPGLFDAVVGVNGVSQHLQSLVELLVPEGKMGLVDDPADFDIFALKMKSISLHWEFMFTRSMYGHSMEKQGALLDRVSKAADEGRLSALETRNLGPLTIEGLRTAHTELAERGAVGKWVFEGSAL